MDINFKLKFAEIRERFGLNQSKLAEKMGIPANAINQIEADKRKPTVRVLYKLLDEFGINLNWFYDKGPMLLKDLKEDYTPSIDLSDIAVSVKVYDEILAEILINPDFEEQLKALKGQIIAKGAQVLAAARKESKEVDLRAEISSLLSVFVAQ